MKNLPGVILLCMPLCISSACFAASPLPAPPTPLNSTHVVTGTLRAVNGSKLSLQTRTGATVSIDAYQAIANHRVTLLTPGQSLTVLGSSFDATGALLATSISRAKPSSALWPPDQ
jgi:hypothetical protein